MKITLLTVPVEVDYTALVPKVRPDTDVFVSSVRSEGQLPVMPKIAIVTLIKWMEANGFTEKDYDFYDVDMLLPSDSEVIEYLNEYKPDIVGLSAVVSTCYAQVKRLSSIIRKVLPDCWIILGGSLTASSNMVLHKSEVDVCVVGDGEIAWVDLLKYIQMHGRTWNYDILANISGLSYLSVSRELIFTGYGKPIPGGSNPLPDYDILKDGLKKRPQEFSNYFRVGLKSTAFQTDPRSYENGRRPMLAQLWSSKGCVARCTFCQRSTKGYRTFSLELLDNHLKELAEDYDVGFIHILDENFGSDNQYARALAKTMHSNGMLWMASGVRVTSVEFDDIRFFKEHGCVSLKFGVESGSQKILDVMEKKFTVDQVFKTLSHCHQLSIYSPLAVMVGMPGETNETASETGQFIGRLSYMYGIDPQYAGVSVFYALPLTGTPLYVYGQQVGVIGKSPDEEEEYLMSVSGTGADKTNYVNLSGAKIIDVIWWNWLVKLEARRTYDALVRKRGASKLGFLQSIIVEDKNREIIGKAMSLIDILRAMRSVTGDGWKSKLFYLGDLIMEQSIIPSYLIAKLPRWLVYPPLRAALILQHILQGWILSAIGRKFNLWKDWPRASQLSIPKELTTGVNIEMSLRRVVRIKTQEKTKEPNAQDILSIGL